MKRQMARSIWRCGWTGIRCGCLKSRWRHCSTCRKPRFPSICRTFLPAENWSGRQLFPKWKQFNTRGHAVCPGRSSISTWMQSFRLDTASIPHAQRFRQWATRVLREHLAQGYTLNRQRFEQNARELETALELVRKAAAGEALTSDQGRGLVELIARNTQTLSSTHTLGRHAARGQGERQAAVRLPSDRPARPHPRLELNIAQRMKSAHPPPLMCS